MELTHLAEKEVLIDQNSPEYIKQQISTLIKENKLWLQHDNIVNEKELYAKLNGKIPHSCLVQGLFDAKKVRASLKKRYRDFYSMEIESFENNARHLVSCCYFLRKDLLVSYSETQEAVQILYTEAFSVEELEAMIKMITPCRQKHASRINIVMKDYQVRLVPLKLKKIVQDIHQLYNDDFLQVHQHIFDKLKMKEVKGLVLLHGSPGTGKTSYIRFLAHKLRKKIIFLPPDMYSSMGSHSLMELLNSSPNSVIIIEDAEYLLKERKNTDNPFLASILNIADGLISDSLNICFICTFNSTLANIDQAALRKGRLIANYEFKPLAVEKANRLLQSKGAAITVSEPTSLADIFFHADPEYKGIKKKKMGF